MGRERKNFKRKSAIRDARLFVIATEGQNTEPLYFEALSHHPQFHNPRVHIELLPSVDGKSAPKYVLQALNEFKKEYRIREDDELWMIIDRDARSWSTAELSHCQSTCKQKDIHFCLSNPCFELWILLHYQCIDSLSDKEKQKIKDNKKRRHKTHCEYQIITHKGVYNKKKPDFEAMLEHTATAIKRAKKLNVNGQVDLFENIGTDIHLLVEKLID